MLGGRVTALVFVLLSVRKFCIKSFLTVFGIQITGRLSSARIESVSVLLLYSHDVICCPPVSWWEMFYRWASRLQFPWHTTTGVCVRRRVPICNKTLDVFRPHFNSSIGLKLFGAAKDPMTRVSGALLASLNLGSHVCSVPVRKDAFHWDCQAEILAPRGGLSPAPDGPWYFYKFACDFWVALFWCLVRKLLLFEDFFCKFTVLNRLILFYKLFVLVLLQGVNSLNSRIRIIPWGAIITNVIADEITCMIPSFRNTIYVNYIK